MTYEPVNKVPEPVHEEPDNEKPVCYVEAFEDFTLVQGQPRIRRGMTGERWIERTTSGTSERVIFYNKTCHWTGSHQDKLPQPVENDFLEDNKKNMRHIDKPKPVDKRLVIGTLVIITLTVVGLVNHKFFNAQLERFVHWSKTLGWWSPVLLFGLSSICPVIMLPVFPLMALSGPLFTEMNGSNPWVGGAVAFASVFGGLWLGSVIAFALGKSVFKEKAVEMSNDSPVFKQLNKIIDKGGIKIVLMARAMPIMPAEIFDYAAALTSLTVWQYAIGCIGSAVPVAFWTFSSAEASAAAHDEASGKGSAGSQIGLIVINVVALAALTALLYRTIQQEAPHKHDSDALVASSPVHTFLRRAHSNGSASDWARAENTASS